MLESTVDDTSGAQQALQIAFQTMQERCQQLQKRLSTVEEENMTLRVERGVDKSEKLTRHNANDESSDAQSLQVRFWRYHFFYGHCRGFGDSRRTCLFLFYSVKNTVSGSKLQFFSRYHRREQNLNKYIYFD